MSGYRQLRTMGSFSRSSSTNPPSAGADRAAFANAEIQLGSATSSASQNKRTSPSAMFPPRFSRWRDPRAPSDNETHRETIRVRPCDQSRIIRRPVVNEDEFPRSRIVLFHKCVKLLFQSDGSIVAAENHTDGTWKRIRLVRAHRGKRRLCRASKSQPPTTLDRIKTADKGTTTCLAQCGPLDGDGGLLTLDCAQVACQQRQFS